MAHSPLAPVQRQLTRVSRRLFLQVLLNSLLWCLAGALALAALWFLAQPLVMGLLHLSAPAWLRWAVAGGLFAAGTGLAVLLAFLFRPSDLAAALSLDEKFNLRERVTTSLTLAPHQANTPAAAALWDDVNQQVADLDVGSRFPLRLSWNAALLPLCGAFLALVALFYNPVFDQSPAPAADSGDKAPAATELDRKIAEVKLKKEARAKDPDRPGEKSDEQKRLEEDLERIFGKPRDTQDQVARRAEEMEALKKDINVLKKDLAEKAAEKAQALKDQLKQAERLTNKQDTKDGPAKDLEKALKDGDLNKAREEIEKLAKKLQNKELSKEEQEKLDEQLKDIKEKMEKLSQLARQDDEAEEKLRELARERRLSEEELNRELEQLRKNRQKLQENLKDLEDIAEQLEQCQKCMKEGDADGAARAMRRAAGKMNKIDKSEELEELSRMMDEVAELQRMMRRNRGDGPGGQGIGAGRRPEEDDQTGSQRTRITGDPDPKGKKEIVGTAPGSNFRTPRKPEELATEIKQASQEAPEALERQRIPRAYGDSAKNYFENLGGQQEPPRQGAKP